MDEVMATAIVLLAALGLLNLVLLLGVVRRIRDHESRLAQITSGPSEMIAAVGSEVGSFTTQSISGEPVESAALEAPTLVGFFSPHCDACHESVVDFRRAAADHPGAALGVVVREGGDPGPLIAGLDGAGTIVVEDAGGPLTQAFRVQGFPAFALLGADGTVLAGGFELPLRPR